MNTLVGQIAAYILAGILLAFAFRFLSKKQYRVSAVMVGGAFVLFAMTQLWGNGIFKFRNGISVEQVLCVVFALGFFGMAIYFTKKNSLSYAFVICLLSVATFFCGLSGVQTLLRTHMLRQVTTSLKSYGEKLDLFQTSVTDMQEDLSRQISTNHTELTSALETMSSAKADVAQQQAAIRAQYETILALQNTLAVAQTNLNEQQKKLENVEYLVNNLFSNTVTESISGSDSNKVIFMNRGAATLAVFRLDSVPIPQSIRGIFQDRGTAGQTVMVPVSGNNYNTFASMFVGTSANHADITFSIQYVKTTPQGRSISRMTQATTNAIRLDEIMMFYP